MAARISRAFLQCPILLLLTLPPFPLNTPLHNPHRRNIHLPPLNHIKRGRPQENAPKHDDVPIHRVRLHWRGRREEAKYEEWDKED